MLSHAPITNRYRAQWRMAASEAGLDQRQMLTLGFRPPSVAAFQEQTEKVNGLNGAQKTRGFPQVVLQWDALGRKEIRRIREAIQLGMGGNYLFLTIDRAIGLSTGPDWVDIKGRPFMPDITPIPKSYGEVTDQIALQLFMVEIVNEPSDYAS